MASLLQSYKHIGIREVPRREALELCGALEAHGASRGKPGRDVSAHVGVEMGSSMSACDEWLAAQVRQTTPTAHKKDMARWPEGETAYTAPLEALRAGDKATARQLVADVTRNRMIWETYPDIFNLGVAPRGTKKARGWKPGRDKIAGVLVF